VHIRVLALIAALAAAHFGWSVAAADRDRAPHLSMSRVEIVTICAVVGLCEAARSRVLAGSRDLDSRYPTIDPAPAGAVARSEVLSRDDARPPYGLAIGSARYKANRFAFSLISRRERITP